jgi:hypothetical protein
MGAEQHDVLGDGVPVGDESPCGAGMGRKPPPRGLTGMGMGNFFLRGDGDGQAFPDGEFPVAILIPAYISLVLPKTSSLVSIGDLAI